MPCAVEVPEPVPTTSEGPLRFDTAQPAPKTKDLLQYFFAPAQPGDDIAL